MTNTTTSPTIAERLATIANAEVEADRYPVVEVSGPTSGFIASIEVTGSDIHVTSASGQVVMSRYVDDPTTDDYPTIFAEVVRWMAAHCPTIVPG